MTRKDIPRGNGDRALAIRSRLLDIILQSQDIDALVQDVLSALFTYLGVDVVGAVLSAGTQEPLIYTVPVMPSPLAKYLRQVARDGQATWLTQFTREEEGDESKSLLSAPERAVGIRSRITLPLIAPASSEKYRQTMGPTQIGLLYLGAKRSDAFSEFSDEELRSLGEYVALAVVHVLSGMEARERLQRLEALRTIDLTIIESHEITPIIEVVIDQVPKKLGAEAIAVHLWNADTQRPLLFTMRLPNGTVLHEEAFQLTPSLLHWLVEQQEPVVIYDVSQDPRLKLHRDIIERYHLASYLGVPMTARGHVVGILHILTTTPRHFSDEDVDFFVTLAGQAAIGISHVQAYQELAERAAAVDAFVKLPEVLVSKEMTDPTDLVGPIMQVLADALHVDLIEFYVYATETQTISLSHAVGTAEHEAILTHYIVGGDEEQNPLARVLKTRTSAYIADIQENSPERAFMGDFRSFYAVPVEAQDEFFGALAFYHSRPYAFPLARRRLIELFVYEIAVLLKNATLVTTLSRTNVELQQALRTRDDMLRNVTHELRTPLTLIRGYAELITMGVITDMQEAREVSETILRNATHLEHLIDQLLHFQTLQQIEMQQMPVDLTAWLREVAADWHRLLEQKGFVVQIEIPDRLGVVLGHPDLLREAIDNILENAEKFSPNKGEIRIRAWRDNGHVYVSISDQGIGIPQDQLERIFDRFYQVDATTTRSYGGMGIGLALAKEIVRQHGGRIWAESEGPGKGTTVTFVLPLAEDAK